MEFLDTLKDIGVVAVIRGKSADDAVAMCQALLKGGLRGLELTYTTPDCCQAVKRVIDLCGDKAVIGVGTVRKAEQIEEAFEAGARFAVSPHFDPDLMCAALETKLPYMPGGLTPTEIVQAWESGATAVKLFPGSAVNADYLKAIRAPLPEIPIMPTGGVSVANLGDWFEAGAVAVGMGGNLAKGTPESIEAAAREVMAALAKVRAAKK